LNLPEWRMLHRLAFAATIVLAATGFFQVGLAHAQSADLVLCEGFKESKLPKLEVVRRAAHARSLAEDGVIDAATLLAVCAGGAHAQEAETAPAAAQTAEQGVINLVRQGMALGLTWEALEDARIPASSLRGENVGVFVGSSVNDYMFMSVADPTVAHPYAITGNSSAVIANRVSYFFDFRGPSMTIDTAGSTVICTSLRITAIAASGDDFMGRCVTFVPLLLATSSMERCDSDP